VAETLVWWKGLKELELDIESLDEKVEEIV
jgi:hypothetical protein